MSQYRKRAPRGDHGYCTRLDRKEKSQRYRTFISWQAMLWRCYSKADGSYKNYGARGIKVCARWRESFLCFVQDMGLKPDGMTLGRKGNDENYNENNCRWETRSQQTRNRRTTVFLEHEGMKLPAAEWAQIKGLSQGCVMQRLYKGWSVYKILSTPGRKQKNSICKWQSELAAK